MPQVGISKFKVVSLFNGKYYQDRWLKDAIVAYSEGVSKGQPDNEHTALAIKFDVPQSYWGQAISDIYIKLHFVGDQKVDGGSSQPITGTINLDVYTIDHGADIDDFTSFDIKNICALYNHPVSRQLNYKNGVIEHRLTSVLPNMGSMVNDGVIFKFDPAQNDIPSHKDYFAIINELYTQSLVQTNANITFGGTRNIQAWWRSNGQKYWNRHEDIEIRWDYWANFLGPYVQKSAIITWRASSGAQEHQIQVNSSEMRGIIPANTISTNQAQFKITATIQFPWNGTTITAESPSWSTLNTEDLQTHTESLSPNGVFVDGKIVILKWTHVSIYGTKQSKADIQYSSTPAEEWKNLATVTGSDTSYTASTSMFPAETVYWRVRGYNVDGLAGVWSEPASFTIRKPPDPPEIGTIPAGARPKITWNSINQAAYQVKIANLIDTGPVSGTAQTYQVMDYFPVGSYVVYVRYQNRYGLWSEYAMKELPIAFAPPAAPVVEAYREGLNAVLWIQNSDLYRKIYILKDGKPIARTTTNAYTDYTAGAVNHYTVRGIAADDSWADTDISIDIPLDSGAVLCAADNPSKVITMQQTSTFQKFNESFSFGGEKVDIVGKRYGIWEYSGLDARSVTANEYLVTEEDAEELKTLCAAHKTVLYRDAFGNRIWGAITQLSAVHTDYNGGAMAAVDMTIMQVDRDETIVYDPPEVTAR